MIQKVLKDWIWKKKSIFEKKNDLFIVIIENNYDINAENDRIL